MTDKEPQGNICADCAKAKGWKPISDGYTVHEDICDYCHEKKGVSTVRDWIWPGRQRHSIVWD